MRAPALSYIKGIVTWHRFVNRLWRLVVIAKLWSYVLQSDIKGTDPFPLLRAWGWTRAESNYFARLAPSKGRSLEQLGGTHLCRQFLWQCFSYDSRGCKFCSVFVAIVFGSRVLWSWGEVFAKLSYWQSLPWILCPLAELAETIFFSNAVGWSLVLPDGVG